MQIGTDGINAAGYEIHKTLRTVGIKAFEVHDDRIAVNQVVANLTGIVKTLRL